MSSEMFKTIEKVIRENNLPLKMKQLRCHLRTEGNNFYSFGIELKNKKIQTWYKKVPNSYDLTEDDLFWMLISLEQMTTEEDKETKTNIKNWKV